MRVGLHDGITLLIRREELNLSCEDRHPSCSWVLLLLQGRGLYKVRAPGHRNLKTTTESIAPSDPVRASEAPVCLPTSSPDITGRCLAKFLGCPDLRTGVPSLLYKGIRWTRDSSKVAEINCIFMKLHLSTF